MPALPRSKEANVSIRSSAETLFAYLDDHRHLGAHMSESSWMMLGSKMNWKRSPGSHDFEEQTERLADRVARFRAQ
jgi:hypothetical protein